MTTDSSQLPNDFIKDEKKKGNGRIRIVLLLVAAIATGYWVYRGQEEVRQPIPPVRPTQPVQPTQPAQPEIRSEIAPIVRTPETEAGTDTEEKAKAVTETTAVETPLPSTEADNPATVIPLPTPTPSVATQAETCLKGRCPRPDQGCPRYRRRHRFRQSLPAGRAVSAAGETYRRFPSLLLLRS